MFEEGSTQIICRSRIRHKDTILLMKKCQMFSLNHSDLAKDDAQIITQKIDNTNEPSVRSRIQMF